METLTADKSLDRRGKTITTFVAFDAAAAFQQMQVGERLEVLTEDLRFFEHDIAAWCGASGHDLVATDAISNGRRFLIEKGPAVEKDTALAMVISMAGLEELLSPLALDHFKVSEDDLIFDDLPQVEYLTSMEVMESADTHIST